MEIVKLLFRGGFGSTSAPCTKIVCGLVHFLAISLNTIACSDTSFHPSPLFLQAIAANHTLAGTTQKALKISIENIF